MSRLEDLARARTDVSADDLAHLALLAADWTLLSDLAFSDFVLWLPIWHGGGFLAADMVRPSTATTMLPDDLVGTYSRVVGVLIWSRRMQRFARCPNDTVALRSRPKPHLCAATAGSSRCSPGTVTRQPAHSATWKWSISGWRTSFSR